METLPTHTNVIVRGSSSTPIKEQWLFAMEDKSYSLCLLAYGRYLNFEDNACVTESFFHPWMADKTAQMNIRGDQVPVPEDVFEEAKQDLLVRLGYNEIDLPEEAKKAAADKFLGSLKLAIAEAHDPDKAKKPYRAIQ